MDYRVYNTLIYSSSLDAYGQETIFTTEKTIKMAINILSQNLQNNILYSGSEYIGLTFDRNIDDKYIILYGDKKLKVKYVNKLGRLTQVFLKELA